VTHNKGLFSKYDSITVRLTTQGVRPKLYSVLCAHR
jgi:hypothetical protein